MKRETPGLTALSQCSGGRKINVKKWSLQGTWSFLCGVSLSVLLHFPYKVIAVRLLGKTSLQSQKTAVKPVLGLHGRPRVIPRLGLRVSGVGGARPAKSRWDAGLSGQAEGPRSGDHGEERPRGPARARTPQRRADSKIVGPETSIPSSAASREGSHPAEDSAVLASAGTEAARGKAPRGDARSLE